MRQINSETKLRVAITINHEEGSKKSVWSSGAWQNVIFLYYLLQQSTRINSVKLLNHALKPAKDLEIVPGINVPVYTLEDIKDDVDVVIVMGIQLGPEITAIFREKAKVLCFHVGNHYIITLENILFDLKRGGGDFDGAKFDAIWTLPHHAKTCHDFLAITNKAPVTTLPYLWNPLFIENIIKNNNLSESFKYKVKDKYKIAIFEPNINIVKSSIYPLLISELAYQQRPDLISGIHVTNTAKFHQQTDFNRFAYTLDITKKGIASFDDRYDTPTFLSYYADIVLTHQWENGLNNLYFDALYGNYPLVHNSEFLRNVGYYYPEFSAQEGARVLIKALEKHDEKAYKKQCKQALADVDIYNADNIKAYENSLFSLFAK